MANTEQMNIARNVRELRLQHDLSQEGLARKANLSKATIQDLERDNAYTTKSPATLSKVARALDVDADHLKRSPDRDEDAELRDMLRNLADRMGREMSEAELDKLIADNKKVIANERGDKKSGASPRRTQTRR